MASAPGYALSGPDSSWIPVTSWSCASAQFTVATLKTVCALVSAGGVGLATVVVEPPKTDCGSWKQSPVLRFEARFDGVVVTGARDEVVAPPARVLLVPDSLSLRSSSPTPASAPIPPTMN